MEKLPIGLSDFKELIQEKYYYIEPLANYQESQ